VSQRTHFILSRRSSPVFVANLGYSYSVAGSRFGGIYERDFETEAEGQEFVRDLLGKSVPVHFSDAKPSRSGLSESDIQGLLDSRGDGPNQRLRKFEPEFTVPPRLVPFLWPLVGVSAVGLAVSLWVHLAALMGHRVVPGVLFFVLHASIFIVWFPAFFAAKGLVSKVRRKDFWKAALRGAPEWMRYMVSGFFWYAVLNFLYVYFVRKVANSDGRLNPSVDDWRGFSGHWMAFYSAALAILYSAARVSAGLPRCPNGHLSSPNSRFCEQCGQRILQSL